jgi:hypothetical protein
MLSGREGLGRLTTGHCCFPKAFLNQAARIKLLPGGGTAHMTSAGCSFAKVEATKKNKQKDPSA